jgi:hypothetical protein
VDSVKDLLIPYISNLDSSKKIYDALTNLFAVKKCWTSDESEE